MVQGGQFPAMAAVGAVGNVVGGRAFHGVPACVEGAVGAGNGDGGGRGRLIGRNGRPKNQHDRPGERENDARRYKRQPDGLQTPHL